MYWQGLLMRVAHVIQSPIPFRIKYEIRLNNQLRRQWQFTSDSTLKAEVNPLHISVTNQLEWRDEQ